MNAPDDIAETMWAVFLARVRILNTELMERLSQPIPLLDSVSHGEDPPSAGCYKASWGWVHVKPGCHCPRQAAAGK